MPNTIEGLLLVIGALFLMIGLIGGGFEMSAAKIPPVGAKGRIGSTIVGVVFLTFAIKSVASRQAQPVPPQSVPQHADGPISKEAVPAKDTTVAEQPQREKPDAVEKPETTPTVVTPVSNRYYRLQIKHNAQFLDAAYCSNKLNLNPGSDFDGGSCELFRFIPDSDGWSRLQLMANGLYLDACATEVGLSAAGAAEDTACQLWKLVPVGDGWSRLRLKRDGRYLEAENCTTSIGLSPISDLEEGACQLWRLVAQ